MRVYINIFEGLDKILRSYNNIYIGTIYKKDILF